MKITTNFALTRHRFAPALAGIAWTTALVLLIAAIGLAIDARAVRQDLPELHARLARLAQRTVAAPNERLPPAADAAALRQRVAATNARVLGRGRPLSAILMRLETLLPNQACLVSLQRRAREGEMLIVTEADSAEPLTAFLRRLEDDPWFSQVLLTRQSPQTLGKRKVVQFEMRVRERS